ncbi:penicillin acylase family protein [Streptomyces sp. TRM66268-LWL]|uniref:Penicillin acylase family protein n=1 Tax=Streptomyces polyasparticus TaxID=2767826 RepID=A0ABR7SGY0_9ACTN|nr:penicillin acylase family protein [Streptomyces polyasparticus]MBC9713741.1 penicillin acylase family protein [Streptomyces polyasparticus]
MRLLGAGTRTFKARSVAAAAACGLLAAGLLWPSTTADASGRDGGDLGDGAVQIRRTAYGIPHIVARDFGSLGYGYGYAFAQDNVCELADTVVTLRGERARYFGAGGDPTDGGFDGPGADVPYNLASDTYYKAQLKAGTVRKLLARKAPLGPVDELREMVAGYADGYNRYLRDTGVDRLPDARCKGKPWVRPVTAEDLWQLVYDVNAGSGAAPYAATIGNAKPPQGKATGAAKLPQAGATGAAKPPRAAAANDTEPPHTPGALRTPAHRPASNGWALGRDVLRPGAGNAMVLANPHLPWVGNSRFYQVQLTIPGRLDVAGASLQGTPMVEIGHNRTLAWTHTASDAQHASLYRLKLAPGDPASYVVDGKRIRMTRTTVEVTVRGEDGKPSTQRRTVYGTRFGAVMDFGWTGTHAYALRDANEHNLRSMNTWLAMGSSRDLDELRAAQDASQGIPWTYTLAADSSGETYFTDSSAVPHLTDEQLERCAVRGGGEEAPDALDGSRTSCAWGSDPDALVPGIHGPARQPELSRTDFVANSNNGPQYTNPASPVTGIPSVYDVDPRLGPRAQLGLRMIEERGTGRDGLGAPGFTLNTLRASMLGNRVLSAETGLEDVLALCRSHPRLEATDGKVVDVSKACAALDRWDGRADADSRGGALWISFYGRLTEQRTSESWSKVPYDPRQPLTTPRGIKGEAPVVQRSLADTVQEFAAQGVPVDAPVGALQKWAGVPLPGCDGSEGCFNVLEASPDSGTGTPRGGAFGTSFLMAVTLTDDGPRTSTLLTYGQSANEASPHYSDQTRLFSQGRWVTERFTEAEILADPHLEVTTLQR